MRTLTVKQFRTWLIANDYTQASLAEKLSISANTITTYVKNERFPLVFIYALDALSKNEV